jgi:hypothetical protein
MLRLFCCVALVAALIASPAIARADDEPSDPAGLAFAVGGGLGVASFAVGTTMMSTSTERSFRNTGVFVGATGLVLAPLAAHAVTGEWGRGALFALPPLVCEGTLVFVFASTPDALNHAPAGIRIPYATAMGMAVVTSAIGVVDAMRFTDRTRKRRVSVSPFGIGGMW